VLALLYLAVVVTGIGMAMWVTLIRWVGAAGASACHLMNPLFGAGLAWAMLGTPLRAGDFLGAAAIAVGLALALGFGVEVRRGGS
jgi:drug/metabolite transporter (DMT)-like permease